MTIAASAQPSQVKAQSAVRHRTTMAPVVHQRPLIGIMPVIWTTPSFLEAVTSGKVGTHGITEAAPR
jgi:hypothetical protein